MRRAVRCHSLWWVQDRLLGFCAFVGSAVYLSRCVKTCLTSSFVLCWKVTPQLCWQLGVTQLGVTLPWHGLSPAVPPTTGWAMTVAVAPSLGETDAAEVWRGPFSELTSSGSSSDAMLCLTCRERSRRSQA